MGLCSSKKSLKVVHPLDVVPDGPTAPAPAAGVAAVEPVAAPAPAAPAAVATPAPAVPKAVAKAKAKAKAKPTSLIKAIKVNDVTVVEEFLQAPDCNLEVLGMWDNTPLLAACMYGHFYSSQGAKENGRNMLTFIRDCCPDSLPAQSYQS